MHREPVRERVNGAVVDSLCAYSAISITLAFALTRAPGNDPEIKRNYVYARYLATWPSGMKPGTYRPVSINQLFFRKLLFRLFFFCFADTSMFRLTLICYFRALYDNNCSSFFSLRRTVETQAWFSLLILSLYPSTLWEAYSCNVYVNDRIL